VIAGGNLDDDPIYFLRDAEITDQYRTIAVTWPGTIGCGQGINEYGLGMVGTTASPRYTKKAAKPSFLTDKFSSPQRVLRSCKTVAEAIEFMKRPDIAGHGNLLFVDAGNNVALVEKYKQTFVSVRYPDEDGFLYAVNNLLSEVTTETRREKMESRNKDRIIALEKHGKQIKKNKHITLEIMKEILRDTYRNESDWSICNYRAYMSTILIPGRREFLVINGPANLGEYIRYSLR
jgi:predicted choloylglycine hydrolase